MLQLVAKIEVEIESRNCSKIMLLDMFWLISKYRT